jgi:hypothetical protein
MAYWTRLMDMELNGVAGHWPVRYCADMILSGHTFVMLLFLLGCADLVRRVHAAYPSTIIGHVVTAVNVVIACCVCADLYLIVVNHFHYTVDVLLAIMVTLLLYTNAGVSILTDWWVEKWEDEKVNERYTLSDGSVWVPPIMFPCCWFQGYYDIYPIDTYKVAEAFENSLPPSPFATSCELELAAHDEVQGEVRDVTLPLSPTLLSANSYGFQPGALDKFKEEATAPLMMTGP